MKRVLRNIGVIFGCFVMIGCLAGGLWLQSFLGAMSVAATTPSAIQTVVQTVDQEGNATEIVVEQEVLSGDAAKYYDWEFGEDYINVLCIGMDARDMNAKYGLTDVMIIASLDLVSQRIRLVSLMRDIYVQPAGYSGHTKLNSVYAAYGGIDELMQTINQRFGVNLTRYAMVNFYGLADIIDRIGGIDIEISSYEERDMLNGLQKEVYQEEGYPGLAPENHVQGIGLQHLDGHQAVAYARIRKVGNGDFERTQRQRNVLEAMLARVKTLGVLAWPSIFYDCKDLVRTNMTPDEIIACGVKVLRFRNVEFEQLRVPMEGSWNYQTIDGLSYVVINYQDNVEAIQQFLMGDYVQPDKQ